MSGLISKILIGNGIADIVMCVLPQARGQLHGLFGHLLSETPAEMKELLLAQLAWGLILHGAVRIFAGAMTKDEKTRNRLGQLSYLFESLQFLSVMSHPGVDRSKVLVPAFVPMVAILMISRSERGD